MTGGDSLAETPVGQKNTGCGQGWSPGPALASLVSVPGASTWAVQLWGPAAVSSHRLPSGGGGGYGTGSHSLPSSTLAGCAAGLQTPACWVGGWRVFLG